ncbi:MAG: cytochrome P450, partial [Congregibacter sp.]|nr:cytochrome P450 [Congregibacter sp.]
MSDQVKVPYTAVRPENLADINLLDSQLQNCPYHAYQRLRDEAPVWQDPITGFYVVSRFDDVRDVLLNPKDFS